MEQVSPDKTTKAPEQAPATVSPSFPVKLPAFLTQLGQDVRWYYDVRLWLPLILVLVILAACTGNQLGKNSVQQAEPAPAQPQLFEMEMPQVQEIQPPTEAPINPEAEALAILAESVGLGRSKNVKTAIMWVAVNRSEDRSHGHGLSLIEEIARPEQWQNYNPDMPYSQVAYEMALDVLRIRDTGGLRPLDNDMLWMVLNDDGSITIRNMFAATANQKWREKTVK